MIKGISGNNGIQVIGGTPITHAVNMSNPSAGMVRYNGNTSSMEVYDGNSWFAITSSYTSIELDARTKDLLTWVETKRREEIKIKSLAAKYPAVKDAKEQLDILLALVGNEIDND